MQDKQFYGGLIAVLVGVFVLGVASYHFGSKERILGTGAGNAVFPVETIALFGTIATTTTADAANFVSLPRAQSFTNATTTNAADTFAAGVQGGFLDGGDLIIQAFASEGADKIRLDLGLKGGTATSTVFIRQQISNNNDLWYDIHASSTPLLSSTYATNTPVLLSRAGLQFDPGTSSTTEAFLFDTFGARFTRFVFQAEDLTTDPDDGIQGWAEVRLIKPRD